MTLRRLLLAAGLALPLGFMASAFWGGFTCPTGVKTFGDRVFLGLVWILLGIAKLGRLTVDPAGRTVVNLWPRALGLAAGLLGAWSLFGAWRRSLKPSPWG